VCCCDAALSLGLSQRTDVSLQGRSSERPAVDRLTSGDRTVIRESRPPSAAGAGLTQTVSSRQAANVPAVRSQYSVGSPKPGTLETTAEKEAAVKSANVQTPSSLDASHAAVTPAVVAASILDRPSRLSTARCPVKLNGISDSDKSADTCSGTYVMHSLHYAANMIIGVGDGEAGGGMCPLKFGKKYFSGTYCVKFGHFSGRNSVKLGNFVNFSG